MKRGAKQKSMTLTAYAERRGVSQPTVSRAVQSGRLSASVVRGPNGDPIIVDPELADQEWEANTDPTKVRGESGESDEDLIDATTRLKVAQPDPAEHKLARELKALTPTADVQREMEAAFAAVRTALMALPSQIKLDLPHLTLDDMAKIDSRLREALEGLAAQGSTTAAA